MGWCILCHGKTTNKGLACYKLTYGAKLAYVEDDKVLKKGVLNEYQVLIVHLNVF